jgi:hypothetical protein
MTIDRRSFLYAGGMTAAAAPFATTAHAASHGARTVTDFGVEPNADRDQTGALQKALDELSKAGLPVVFPSGFYRATKLTLPSSCTIMGNPRANLHIQEIVSGDGPGNLGSSSLRFYSLFFQGARSGPDVPQLRIHNAFVTIVECTFAGGNGASAAIGLENCTGALSQLQFDGFSSHAISVSGTSVPLTTDGLTISACRISGCGSGIRASSGRVSVTQNNIGGCGNGIVADGTGIVSGNIITGAKNFGLKLGSAKGNGHILAQGNILRDCRIGIGVSSSGDDIMASLNMIAGAKDGAIRAFDGDRLVGPDLARQSAEAYLNLMVAGNVVR